MIREYVRSTISGLGVIPVLLIFIAACIAGFARGVGTARPEIILPSVLALFRATTGVTPTILRN